MKEFFMNSVSVDLGKQTQCANEFSRWKDGGVHLALAPYCELNLWKRGD